MAGQAALRNFRTWFVCHRDELITQTHLTFQKYGISHGIVGGGHMIDASAPVQVCSIDTLKNRLHVLPPPKQILWDECHHLGAAGWLAVQEAVGPKVFNIGFSATPIRTDGTGLEIGFDAMVQGPQTAWLIEQGHLSEYRYFAPPPASDPGQLMGDVVAHWWKRARGLRTVGFAKNVKHSLAMVAAFNAAGIPSAHIDGTTPKDERRRIIRAFAMGEILVLWNVALIGEGFDLAAIAQMEVTIDCVILNRKTESLSLFLQWVGRALRPKNYAAIILDHGGNLHIHGAPDDERTWTLEGCKRGGGGDGDSGPPPPVACGGCYEQIKRPLPENCPHCGEPLVKPGKEVKQVEGELQEVTSAAAEKRKARWELNKEQADCKTLAELVALGQRRGHKSPQQWAIKIWSSRMQKRAAVA